MTEHIDNPGQPVYVPISRVVNAQGRVIYVPKSCSHTAYQHGKGLFIESGQSIRVRWQDRSVTRENIVYCEHIETVDRGKDQEPEQVTSELFGFWHAPEQSMSIHGTKLKEPRAWVELSEVELEMPLLELKSIEHMFGVGSQAAPAAPQPPQDTSRMDALEEDMGAIKDLLQKLAGTGD